MHNIIKIHAWAEPYVNFLQGETSPLKLETYIFVSVIMNFNTTDCSGKLAYLRRLI